MTKEHRLYEKPIPVKAIDTTGAGDAFAAAFLYQLLRDGISREQLPHLSKRYFASISSFFQCICS